MNPLQAPRSRVRVEEEGAKPQRLRSEPTRSHPFTRCDQWLNPSSETVPVTDDLDLAPRVTRGITSSRPLKPYTRLRQLLLVSRSGRPVFGNVT